VKAAVSIVILSLLAIPMMYTVNSAQTFAGELGLLVAGVISLSVMCVLTYVILLRFHQSSDWLFYVFTLSLFSSVVDIFVGLESDGYVSGFMTNYLKNGEPYLNTPYGSVICYWDGTVHYALYLVMLTAMCCRWRYRVYGLYWVGSIGHCMLVLLPGAILSKQGVRWSIILNAPYFLIPVVSAVRFLRERRFEELDSKPKTAVVTTAPRKLYERPLDAVFIVFLVASIGVALLRGFAVLGSPRLATTWYINNVEPYLTDPVGFPKAQMIVYMYYFIPFYAFAVYALLQPGCRSLPDWAVIFAGAAAQAQVSHIISSLHPRTALELHVPDGDARFVFWLVNMSLLVIPHLFALRCWHFQSVFCTVVDDCHGGGGNNAISPKSATAATVKTVKSKQSTAGASRRVKKLD
jgi:hypothetical protein